jgi:hypothetical protein
MKPTNDQLLGRSRIYSSIPEVDYVEAHAGGPNLSQAKELAA